MVVEVVPLPEIHWTLWVVTFQDLKEPLSSWIFEFENSKGSCTWDMVFRLFLVNFDFLNVSTLFEIAAFYNLNHIAIRWNLLFDTFVIDHVSRCIRPDDLMLPIISAQQMFQITAKEVDGCKVVGFVLLEFWSSMLDIWLRV